MNGGVLNNGAILSTSNDTATTNANNYNYGNDSNRIAHSNTYIVKKVDEMNMNSIMDSISQEQFERMVNKRLPTPSNKRKIVKSPMSNRAVLSIIESLHLHDEESHDQRVINFIELCRLRNYSPKTVRRYFTLAKRTGIFDKSQYVPNLNEFEGKPHVRIVNADKFDIFIKYLHDNWSKYTSPLLIPYYTALRTAEVLQFSTQTLVELKERRLTISSIRRKQTITDLSIQREPNFWTPTYHTKLINFIDHLIELFDEEYKSYVNNPMLPIRLYNFTASTLLYRMNVEYKKATGDALPYGFGIHGYKTMIATLMSDHTTNIRDIQHFHQHKSPRTTQKYICKHWNTIQTEFNKLTKEFA